MGVLMSVISKGESYLLMFISLIILYWYCQCYDKLVNVSFSLSSSFFGLLFLSMSYLMSRGFKYV